MRRRPSREYPSALCLFHWRKYNSIFMHKHPARRGTFYLDRLSSTVSLFLGFLVHCLYSHGFRAVIILLPSFIFPLGRNKNGRLFWAIMKKASLLIIVDLYNFLLNLVEYLNVKLYFLITVFFIEVLVIIAWNLDHSLICISPKRFIIAYLFLLVHILSR